MEPEDLGGWRMHAEVTGMVDAVVDTDEAAMDVVRRFLSYLPSHHGEPAPTGPKPATAPDGRRIREVLKLERTKVYDMKRVIDGIVDPGSLLELKPRYAKNLVTALARIDGRVVGIVANNPLHKGGAIDVPACEKAPRKAPLSRLKSSSCSGWCTRAGGRWTTSCSRRGRPI